MIPFAAYTAAETPGGWTNAKIALVFGSHLMHGSFGPHESALQTAFFAGLRM